MQFTFGVDLHHVIYVQVRVTQAKGKLVGTKANLMSYEKIWHRSKTISLPKALDFDLTIRCVSCHTWDFILSTKHVNLGQQCPPKQEKDERTILKGE